MFGQSGGPTSVINSSAAGVFTEALKQDNITAVYGLEHGIVGLLNEKFFDMSKEDAKEIELLKYTPSSALGSVRYKLKDASVDDTDYKRILEVFKKYNVRYFFYNGGNDSMDTCNKISKYLQSVGYECNVVGVPKTIDNDLTAQTIAPVMQARQNTSQPPLWKSISTQKCTTHRWCALSRLWADTPVGLRRRRLWRA